MTLWPWWGECCRSIEADAGLHMRRYLWWVPDPDHGGVVAVVQRRAVVMMRRESRYAQRMAPKMASLGIRGKGGLSGWVYAGGGRRTLWRTL